MSLDLLELIIDRLEVDVSGVNPEGTRFMHEDVQCAMKSVNPEEVQLTVGESTITSDDADELVDFFHSEFGMKDDREAAIDELTAELRSAFGKRRCS